ncbi:GNAT family N-acetyltransferase [Singulisphaera sp. PoT]|uniref:GNAT family N-acetyltransferase n=1 Tax=Singulisphaera sp. PoT TaxID=3411797 RepID=UPI003BF4C802
MGDIGFRNATLTDAELLFAWRNDPETREHSHNTGLLEFEKHVAWLEATLANPRRDLRIAEWKGIPVGTVRIDLLDDGCELSWTVAPESRGKGIGKQMIKSAVEGLSGAVFAEIKAGNIASSRMAEYAGMELISEKDGVLTYRSLK